MIHRVPPLPERMAAWERYAAQASHFLLYVLIVGIPLSGWALASSSPLGIPTIWFGQAEVPHLPGLQGYADQHAVEDQVHEVHELLGNLMIGLLLIHVGAALKHHFWDRDDVLTRMLPFTKSS
jgi:cytochrome b561